MYYKLFLLFSFILSGCSQKDVKHDLTYDWRNDCNKYYSTTEQDLQKCLEKIENSHWA